MTYGSDFIEKVRASSDIGFVAGQYIPLKKAGVNFTALCPFHSEKTPSFVISKQKQIFKCFGCGEGGNVFTFVMKMEKISFPEAVRVLAVKAGIPAPDKKVSPLERRKEELYEVMEKILRFYSKNIKQSRPALNYLDKRGITREMIETFNIGFSPDEDSLISFARGENISASDLEKLGLVVPRSGHAVDKFRFRIIFPIHDIRGRTVAFGGRTIKEENTVKYINSPETVLFHKSDVLFSMSRAKKAVVAERAVIVTEGYMDVLTLYQFGFKNVCGVLGTALTDQHLYQLRRFTDKIFLLFDSDFAGITAVLRAAPKILSAELEGFAVQLSGAKDVDEFLRKKGRTQLQECLAKALPVMDFVRSALVKRYSKGAPDWKAKVVREILPLIREAANAVTREEEIKRTAALLDVSVSSIKEEMTRTKRAVYREEEKPLIQDPKKSKLERRIVSFLINYPEMIDRFKKEIAVSDFTYMEKFLSKIYDFFDRKEGISIAKFISLFPEPADAEFISGITSDALKGLKETVDPVIPGGVDKQKLNARKNEADGLIAEFKRIVGMESFEKLRKICSENPTNENIAKFEKVMKYSGQRGGYS
ncbi:MAG: DNA primase [bacterium]